MSIGARLSPYGACEFTVWAPAARSMELELLRPDPLTVPMQSRPSGYWQAQTDGVSAGVRYRFRLNGEQPRPDPASHFQPDGVHEASAVVDHGAFAWSDDAWRVPDLSCFIIYELHIGTFTREGTFDGAIRQLGHLRDLGITAVEIMPVAAFPGSRNWGYDGVYPFAVQASYGGPEGLKRLVNACHELGIAVVLDVVYNHLGPEGNYLSDFGPYFTGTYRTPWGQAINFDGPHSDEVVRYFVENALHWFAHYHVDALRLDAIHAIYDQGAQPFLQRLAQAVERFSEERGQRHYLVAESDLNDAKIIRPLELGGFGLDAQWADDLHHCVHTLLTGERAGYYEDFGALDQLVKCLRVGYTYTGQPSRHRQRSHGNYPSGRPGRQFVVCSQNHDQVGNRMLGERLTALLSFEALKLAGAVPLVSPFLPLLFMGEEWAETAPFLYFVSHGDPALIEAVRRGRRDEFESFRWAGVPPDPQSTETFERSRIHWGLKDRDRHAVMLEFYRELIRLRKTLPALAVPDKESLEAGALDAAGAILLRRWQPGSEVAVFMNFGVAETAVQPPLPEGTWRLVLDSADTRWRGPGTLLPDPLTVGATVSFPPHSLALYLRQSE